MGYQIFPGVYTTIKDESFYTQPVPGAIGFICLFSEKGPDNTVRMCTSVQDLIATYGKGNPALYGQGWYVAKQYVNILGNMYILRVLPSDATFSVLCLNHTQVDVDEDGTNEDVLVQVTPSSGLVSKAQMDTLITNGDAEVIFYPAGRGEWYNNLSIKLTPALDYTNAYVIDIYQAVEGSTIPVLAESYTVSFNPDATDSSNESMFITDVLERYSDTLRCLVSDAVTATEAETWMFDHPFTTWIGLAGGSDGTMYDANGKLNWAVAQNDMANAYSGLATNPMTGEMCEEITDPDCLMFTVVFDGGYPTAVKDCIVDLVDVRSDCMALLDNGDNSRPQTALTTRQTDHNYNTYLAALYECYTKIYDTYTGKYVWMTPLYHVAQCLAKTARDYNVWWPFAGLTRGVCDGIKDFRYKLVGGYKENFKLNQINPIMRWSNGGDCIWGNWTTQGRASALQNIHVVLCLLYIKRTLEWNLKYDIYDLNDTYTWEIIKDSVNKFLGQLKTDRALEWYKVSVFATDYDKKISRCQVQVDLQVVGAIEVISLTLAVH